MCRDLFSKNTHQMYYDIFYSIFFESEKKTQTFKYNPTEYNVISLVLFLLKTTCIILYCLIMITYNLYKIRNYNHLSYDQ